MSRAGWARPGSRDSGGLAANYRPMRTGVVGRGKGRDAAQAGPRPSGPEGAGHCVVGGASKRERAPRGSGFLWGTQFSGLEMGAGHPDERG